ncbi:hypothetical protein Taro_055013 [Colocasia esculenta]|uniref:Secreted protein n=1 Tax=Colocasia esculenta TaxID=4460 RepID=A0A843XRN9_COLES|nr:hypothetical protein [Colocasia esculenta]
MVLASLVSVMGVWLVVLLWKCQSHLVVFPCVWKRLVGAHCCDLPVESSSLGLDCCVQSTRLLLVKVVDLDPVCGPVFGQFSVLFAFKFLGCADGTTGGSLWFSLLLLAFPCRHTLADGCLASVVVVRLVVPPVEVLALRRGFLFRVRRRPVVCLLSLLSVGCLGWWCFHMAFGAMSHTVVTFVVKVPPLVLS